MIKELDLVYLVSYILRSEQFLSIFCPHTRLKWSLYRIEIFMLKLVCGENFVLFGHLAYYTFVWNLSLQW